MSEENDAVAQKTSEPPKARKGVRHEETEEKQSQSEGNDIVARQDSESIPKARKRGRRTKEEAKQEEEKERQSQYIWGTGKRKCAIAQVRLFPGEGKIIINGKSYEEAFPRLKHRRMIELPFLVTNTVGKFHTTIKVGGGGVSGQAGAIRHGIARSLVKENELFKSMLRKEGLLTRDARIKERKKYGLKRARKAPQYTKR